MKQTGYVRVPPSNWSPPREVYEISWRSPEKWLDSPPNLVFVKVWTTAAFDALWNVLLVTLSTLHGGARIELVSLVLLFGFCRMKYGVDKDSPSNWDQPDEVYEILSKPTRQGAARAKEEKRTATLLD